MATETERKFLVIGDGWREGVSAATAIQQAYLAMNDALNVRVRIVDDGRATLTIKSAEPGMTRTEFEYPIPLGDAQALMQLRVGDVIEKKRHIVPFGSLRWEVDVFEGAHRGLILAEVELPGANADIGRRPDWLGEEVTDDPRYYNANLANASRPAG